MNRRNRTVYRATFRGLQFQAFGVDQTMHELMDIEVYQVECKSEKWRARPFFQRAKYRWESSTPEHCMKLVEACFVKCITGWVKVQLDPKAPPRLRPEPENAARPIQRARPRY